MASKIKALFVGLPILLFCCSPGVFQYLGRPAEDPEVALPLVESFFSENTIRITWEQDIRADEYLLYRAVDTNADDLTVVYQGSLTEYSDTTCTAEVRYLYSLSKIRGLLEFGPSPQVPGVCGTMRRDFQEPNNTRETAVLLAYELNANIYYYRDNLGNITEDTDWYYLAVPPRRTANIVVTQPDLAGLDTYMYFYLEGEIPFKIPNNTDLPVKNYTYAEKNFYFKIYPVPDEFLNELNQAGGSLTGYHLALNSIGGL